MCQVHTHHIESPPQILSPSIVQTLSIERLALLSCAELKFVTTRHGMPKARDTRENENTHTSELTHNQVVTCQRAKRKNSCRKLSHLKIRISTCARGGGKHPALAVTDRATLVPPLQNLGAAIPVPWEDPVQVVFGPIPHKHAVVVVAVDLWGQNKEDGETRWTGTQRNQMQQVYSHKFFAYITKRGQLLFFVVCQG